MKKIIFIVWISFFSLISCQKQTNPENSEEEKKTNVAAAKKISTKIDSHTSQNSLDYIGVYKGILPCADCRGIITTIELKENETYSMKTSYQGKSLKVFEENGRFTWNDKGNTVVLNDTKNAPNQYFVGEHTLTQLDRSGKKITGELAADYVLRKEMASTEMQKEIEGSPSDAKLNNRIITRTVIKTVNPAEGKFALAKTHWKLIELNGKKVKQKGKKDFYIKLNSKDGRFHGYAGCNNFNGNYAMPKSFEISFSNIASTMMACDTMDLETKLMKTLEEVDSYSIKGNILQLKKEKLTTLVKFEAVN